MAIPLTFLAASTGVPMAKTITAKKTIPYPRVKNMTSHDHFISASFDGLTEAFGLFRDHAALGHAFLKGSLRKPLENETRAGQTDKYALTQTLVIDVDSLPMDDLPQAPVSAEDVEILAHRVIQYLPKELHNVSCIAHAGSSFRIVEDKVSMHLVFLLTRPVGPEGLKEWLTQLNFENEALKELLTLTPQNMSIKYIIDPVLARNTHLLFIADPQFEGRESPFADERNRWALVSGEHHSVDLIPLLATACPQKNKLAIDTLISKLRKDKGLPKFKPKLRAMTGMGGEKIQVVANPDALNVEYAHENDEFVYFNINGGDSHAYFCPKHNPDIIYNFKNEPPFELAKANPGVHEWLLEKYADVIKEKSPVRPLLIRDREMDQHYSVTVDMSRDRVLRITEVQKANAGDWMAEQGYSMPDPIPTWDLVFDPQSEVVVDPHNKVLNHFQINTLLRDPVPLLPTYHRGLGEAKDAVESLCPTIYKLMWSICGSSDLEFESFTNWLAAVLQLRRKLTTAWVFSGVPGTGKGVFYERVLRPLIGEEYTRRKRLDQMEDQFDAHMARTLLVVMDEFRLADSSAGGKLLNKIKDEIASETGSVRAMRKESKDAKLWSNYLIFSNHTDVIRIEDGDRRFNVAPPQTMKLEHRYPEITEQLDRIDEELPTFASFLMHFTINERAARTCLENQAKADMKDAAMSWIEQFCMAIRRGDLDYFLYDLLSPSDSTDTLKVLTAITAKKVAVAWAQDALASRQSCIPVEGLLAVYNGLSDKEMTRKKFASMLAKHDVSVQKIQHNGVRGSYVLTNFRSATYTDEELANLLTQHTTPQEQAQWQTPIH